MGNLTPGLMPNSLGAVQAAFDSGSAGEKSTFQAAVSGADYVAGVIGGFTTAQIATAKLPKFFTATVNQNVAVTYGSLSLRMSSTGGVSLEYAFVDHAGISDVVSKLTASTNTSSYVHNQAYTANTFQKAHAALNIVDAGAMQEVSITDITAGKIYMCVLLVGSGYNNNFISINQVK